MLTNWIVGLITICVQVVAGLVRSVVALVVHLLGPGVIWVAVPLAAFWWFGWLPI